MDPKIFNISIEIFKLLWEFIIFPFSYLKGPLDKKLRFISSIEWICMDKMTTYKIHINDRNYSSWEIFDNATLQKVSLVIDPLKEKLFSNDVFIINENGSVTILHSTVRSGPPSPAVLVLEGNKTYGRCKQNDKKNNKLLYKCIPDDKRLPAFLVPYEIKNVGFSKVFANLYVTIQWVDWDNKHPNGLLSHVIGPVDVLDNYYEYQLYCKSLNASIQGFQRATTKAIEKNTHEAFISSIRAKHPSIEDRMNQEKWHIISIDPPSSLDYDDAYSIQDLNDGTKCLSIYISNVTIWMDVLNLWDSFSRRISTIYLPDKKRPMLPTVLSDCLCSLQENVTRIAFVIDIYIKDNEIIETKFCNAFIKVFKNYRYEEDELYKDAHYLKLMETTKGLSRKFKYIPNVRNSHELVCYLMVLMNYHCAKKLLEHNTGIFRSTIMKREIILPEHLPEDVAKFIKIWSSASGQYVDGSLICELKHDLLEMEAYIHITSPIRRLVDLLNIIKFQQCTGMIQLSENIDKFYEKWLHDLEYINVTMRAIRKIQCDCSLLDLCANNPDVMEKEYDGYIFDKINRNDGLHQYVVFLPDLKLSSRVTMREELDNYEKRKFKLHLFKNEETFKRKIRIQMANL